MGVPGPTVLTLLRRSRVEGECRCWTMHYSGTPPPYKARCRSSKRGYGMRRGQGRRERDSNPRMFPSTVFKTVAFNHSAISPFIK